jgi:Ricin-type beta-trefoil lectin domain-like
MKRIALAKLRRGAPFGAGLLVVAFAASGAMAAPALAAQGGARAARTETQTVVPASSIGSEPVARGCYNGGQISMTDGSVMDAKGYGNPASIDDYGSNGGTNQQWALCELNDGYDEIVSDYNGQLMCLNVSDASYTSGEHLLAYPCNTVVAGNEQWRRPENTPDGNYSGFDYLVPAGNYNLCANVSGGLGTGHLLILYACNSGNNEGFGVAGSNTVKDRLGMATEAASYLGYQASDECNEFSGYWKDGTSCSDGYYAADWCADFDAYVWRFGGDVSFNYKYATGYINGGAISFYSYAQSKGTWHWASSGYTPKPGDVAVYGMNSTDTYASHAALVIGKAPGDSGPNVINGNDGDDAVGYSTDQSSSSPGDNLGGYASPPGL